MGLGALIVCPSRIFGGARVLCFVKRIHRGRSAAGIGRRVGGGGGEGWTGAPVARQPKEILRFRCNRARHNSLHSQLSRCPTFVPMMKTADLRQCNHRPKIRRLHRPTRRRVLFQRQLPSIALDSPTVVISLPWIAVSLVTKLVTVALDCPGLPSRLVTELVTEIRRDAVFGRCRLAFMQAPFSFRLVIESTRIAMASAPRLRTSKLSVLLSN